MTDEDPRAGRVVVIGSANMDIIARVPHLPGEGETVLGESLLHAPGGKGANQAVAAARAGSSVAFVGCVGEDQYGNELVAGLRDAGVSNEYVATDGNEPSGVALITVDEEGRNTIAVVPGANRAITTAEIDRAMPVIGASAVVVLQLEIPLEVVMYAMEAARAAGARVILNPAPATHLELPFLRLCDILVPNRNEVGRLAGVGPPTEAASGARMLVSSGVPAVIVTLGGEGAVIVAQQSETTVPAIAVPAIDTTGAGDAFVGNLASRVSQDEPLDRAARFAAAAAALSVQRRGAQPAMPTLAETEALLREQGS